MTLSRAELAALLMKATRGAGLPLALAEDLYQAAAYLTAQDVHDLAEDLATGGPRLIRLSTDLDAIACGEHLTELDPLAPSFAATRGWGLHKGQKTDTPQAPPSNRITLPPETQALLDRFASKNYVPESETSRARGAGAGSIDND